MAVLERAASGAARSLTAAPTGSQHGREGRVYRVPSNGSHASGGAGDGQVPKEGRGCPRGEQALSDRDPVGSMQHGSTKGGQARP